MELHRPHNLALTFSFLFCIRLMGAVTRGLRVPLPQELVTRGRGGAGAIKYNGNIQIERELLFYFILRAPAQPQKKFPPHPKN